MNRLEHLLTILSEECAEVQQAVSKILRFGLEDTPDTLIPTNHEALEMELNDLRAAVEMLREEGLDLRESGGRVSNKKNKVEHYLLYSKERGHYSDA